MKNILDFNPDNIGSRFYLPDLQQFKNIFFEVRRGF